MKSGKTGLIKGTTKLKLISMPNKRLIKEWLSVRINNEQLSQEQLEERLQRSNCQIPQTLFLEELFSEELLNRGLFDFALNDYKKAKEQAQKIWSTNWGEVALYYS
ncbi:MAG: hypothetical protein K9W42_12105 [Candidatus Heimdallarchaeota archaeon]|nr:hypothetical protein [Candidatus Heimdallarchaeota archaeon]